MFLTTFDRKMYEEAIREEGREELAQKYEELSRKHENLVREYAVRLFENGVSYEVARTIITEISAEELEQIYKENQQ